MKTKLPHIPATVEEMTYTRRARYTPEELDALALADLRNLAEFKERQAENGPYFPERGITRESLIAYAQKLRAQITKYQTSGAHSAVIRMGNGPCPEVTPKEEKETGRE